MNQASALSVDDVVESGGYDRRWLTLGVLCLSLVVIGIDNTILNVAIPTLSEQLQASMSQLQWIVDGYTLVFAGLLLTAGSLGDRFGRRGALSIGLAIFAVGSGLSALSGTPGQLTAARALMGVGAAFIMPATLSIVTNVFTIPAERAKAIAIWAGFSAIGIAVGPVAGGYLLKHFYWGSVFLVNIPFAVIALVLGRFLVPTSKDSTAPKLDPLGAVMSIVGLVVLLWAIIEAPSKGWASTQTIVAFVIATVLLVGFVVWELRSTHPMLDVRIFENPRFSAASIAITLTFFAMFGSLFLLTQYMQDVLGYSPLGAGVRVAPFALVMMVIAPMSTKFVDRLGTKVVVVTGLTIIAGSLLYMVWLDPDMGYTQVFIDMVIMAFGMALTMAPATESIMGALPRDKAGVGSAVNDTTRQVGGALGVAVIGSLFSSRYMPKMADVIAGSSAPVPPEMAEAIKGSIGGARSVAEKVAEMGMQEQADALMESAKSAFVSGMHSAVLVGAIIAFIGALVALFFLPARAADEELGELQVTDVTGAAAGEP